MIRYHYVIFIFTFYFSNKLWAIEGLLRSLQNKKQNKIKSKGHKIWRHFIWFDHIQKHIQKKYSLISTYVNKVFNRNSFNLGGLY